jgi:hypothetical protein
MSEKVRFSRHAFFAVFISALSVFTGLSHAQGSVTDSIQHIEIKLPGIVVQHVETTLQL